mgnify:CR=1 FL=1
MDTVILYNIVSLIIIVVLIFALRIVVLCQDLVQVKMRFSSS